MLGSLKSNLKIDWEVACLPIGHLRLSTRAHKAVASFKTIGALLIAIRDSAPSAHWTPTVRTEIESVISDLLATVEGKGIAGWDRFRSTRYPPKDVNGKSPLYFMSPALRRLDAKVRTRSLATLHLHVRTLNALEQIGIATIGELVSAAATGLEPFPAAGQLTAAEILESLEALSQVVSPKGTVSWVDYAQRRGFRILPRETAAVWSGRKFLQHLEQVLDSAVQLQYGDAGVLILGRHLLAPPEKRLTFREISRHLRRTPERARAIEERLIKMLRRAIWLDDYRGCKFRFRPEFLDPIKRLAHELEAEGMRLFSAAEWNKMLTHQRCHFNFRTEFLESPNGVSATIGRRSKRLAPAASWDRLLRRLWDVSADQITLSQRLILQLLGFRLVLFSKKAAEGVMIVDSEKSKDIRAIAKTIEWLLTAEYPQGLAPRKLYPLVRQRTHSRTVRSSELTSITRSLSCLEKTRGLYRARLQFLRRPSDRYARILQKNGHPLHFRELAKKAGISTVEEERKRRPFSRVSSVLASDKRFVHIGRSGLWRLSEWKDIEDRSIGEIAFALLETAKKPMTERELFVVISKRRPCAFQSIGTILKPDQRFERLAPRTWRLRELFGGSAAKQ